MISSLLFGLIASACAAPHYGFPHQHHHHHGPPPFLPQYHHQSDFDNYFDTNKFWADLSKEMRDLNDMLSDIDCDFPTSNSQEGVEDNEYKITIPLSGFEEKDIIVKASEGRLMIQAHHKSSDGNERNYLNVRDLPNSVNANGTWNYDKNVLKLVFPLKEGVETQTVKPVTVITTDISTAKPPVDREEIDENTTDQSLSNHDVDVEVNRGDLGDVVVTSESQDRNAVEATTYAVDLKDEVEFVPVRY